MRILNNKYKSFLLRATLISFVGGSILKGAESSIALKQEQQKQVVDEGIDTRTLPEIESSNTPNLYTQTQAHLKLSYVRELIGEKYSDSIAPYLDVISQVLVKEGELKNTHYAFYHATSNSWSVYSDLLTQLYSYFSAEKSVPSDFKFLRFKESGVNVSAQSFLSEELKKSGLVDDSGELKNILLSVNLSLFGNMGSDTECTWKWFVKDERGAPDDKFYHSMMDSFGLTHDYVGEMMALEELIKTEEASLLQIMIPQDVVDEIAYLAWIRGVPANNEMMEWIKNYQSSKAIPKRDRGSLAHTKMSREALAQQFKDEQNKNPIFRKFMEDLQSGEFSMQAFLKAYCNKPWDLENINDTAGRILFTPDGLLNPSSGIKFYRYLTTSRDKLKEYNLRLNLLVQKLIQEKEAREDSAAAAA